MSTPRPHEALKRLDSRELSLVVLCHKPCWPVDPNNGHGSFQTDGGFPDQMAAIANLFRSTRVLVTRSDDESPGGLRKLEGRGMRVSALPMPKGRGVVRKLLLPLWLLRNSATLISELRRADVVHAVVPGDIGVLAILLARLSRKPLLVRHCGTWGNRSNLAYRYLARTLPRLAKSRRVPTVILATGGATEDQTGNEAFPQEVVGAPGVHWIFSTSLSSDQLRRAPRASPWQPGQPFQLLFVGRLSRSKNVRSLVEAMPLILEAYQQARLTVLGHGEDREPIEQRIAELGLEKVVTLRGNVERRQVLQELAHSSLMVFPTRVAEGFPKAVLEALACGVPVLAPPISVLPRLLGNGSGRLLTSLSPQGIADEVIHCLENPEFFRTASSIAVQTASRYSLERWAEEIGLHLEGALARRDREQSSASRPTGADLSAQAGKAGS